MFHLDELDAKVDTRCRELDAKIEAVRAELKRDLATLEANLKRDIEFIRRDMKEMEQRLVIKFGGMLLVAVGAISTLIKIL